MTILYLLTVMIGMWFFFMNHPISMGISIIIYMIPLSILIGMNSQNFWYSYVIILIYLGGLLILFLYITSLASNEKKFFKPSWSNKIKWIFMFILLSPTLMMFYEQTHNMDSVHFNEQIELSQTLSYTSFFAENISKITIFLATYLLLCLISVVKVCRLTEGPIRTLI